MHDETIELLKQGLTVHKKPGKGSYPYVKTTDVIKRMNECFGHEWTSEVRSTEQIGDEYVVRLTVKVYNTSKDEYGAHHRMEAASHDGYGSAKIFGGVEMGSIIKSAKSRAIKDACRHLGIGLELRDTEQGGVTNTNTPPPPINPIDNKVFMPPIGGIPSTPPPNQDTAAPQVPLINEIGTPPPTTDATGFPQQQPVVTATPPPQQVVTTGLPAHLQQSNTEAQKQVVTPPAPMTGADGKVMISDVQKVAMESMLNIKGLNYDEAATAAFTKAQKEVSALPKQEDLTYDEAVLIIQYANDYGKD